jgi:ABC-type Fe3+ transport system permease subunit
MFKKTKTMYYTMGAAITAGALMTSNSAFAAAGNNFSKISENIGTSIQSLPGMLSGLAYLFGILLGVLGVMKIKDHVENPSNTPLKDGAIRLAAGGALFALPILFEAMNNTIGSGTQAGVATLNKVEFAIK